MKNRVAVTIAGQEYTLVGTEDAGYTEKVAAHVDEKVREVLEGARVSRSRINFPSSLMQSKGRFSTATRLEYPVPKSSR